MAIFACAVVRHYLCPAMEVLAEPTGRTAPPPPLPKQAEKIATVVRRKSTRLTNKSKNQQPTVSSSRSQRSNNRAKNNTKPNPKKKNKNKKSHRKKTTTTPPEYLPRGTTAYINPQRIGAGGNNTGPAPAQRYVIASGSQLSNGNPIIRVWDKPVISAEENCDLFEAIYTFFKAGGYDHKPDLLRDCALKAHLGVWGLYSNFLFYTGDERKPATAGKGGLCLQCDLVSYKSFYFFFQLCALFLTQFL